MSGKGKPEPDQSIEDFGAAGDGGALAHYDDPAYYTKTYKDRRHDVDYYVRLARECKGPVLEYGVGNGRIALQVARAGVTVHGIDLSRPMLEDFTDRLKNEPKQVRARVTLQRGDMRSADASRRFALVYAPFNCLLHLYERADMEAFLTRVRAHLAPGGRFVFDFSVPHGEDLSRDPERAYGAPRVRHPTTGDLVRYAERFEYDRVRQLLLVWMEFTPESGGKAWRVPLTHRQYFPCEVEALLHYNGFSDITFTADFTDQPPDGYVDSMVVFCRARPERRAALRLRRPPERRPAKRAKKRLALKR